MFAWRVVLVGVLILTASIPAEKVYGDSLVDAGRRLFTGETFGGNGRTCATCHPPDHDFTLDPGYIARLPATDPLFVHERDAKLAGLEDPLLLRRLALIRVHADGLDRPAVLRGVPHLLGIARSLVVEFGTATLPGTNHDLPEVTGWSGDGGSLRRFAIGAIRDHMTRSLARIPGIDFRLPTDAELSALAAYMRSLGRTEADELDLADATGVKFADLFVDRGRALFNSEVSGTCAFCHNNATALNDGGFNGMFDIGVQRQPRTRARRLRPTVPFDGGFGSLPPVAFSGAGGFGDGRFNTPSLIEAADTTPLFHDNSAATIEEAVRFYTTRTFADSPDGQTRPTVLLGESDVQSIAAMLRSVNSIENIREARELLGKARGRPKAQALPLLRLARTQTKDARRVLVGGPVSLYPAAVAQIEAAFKAELAATAAGSQATRDSRLDLADRLLASARGLMLAS